MRLSGLGLIVAKEPPPCCEAWRRALQMGTDAEAYGSLIAFHDRQREEHPGRFVAGFDMPPLNFCPWCGAKKP